MSPERVAILGGGLGALSTAFELSDPRHGGRYDITLYQLGWRLGGKGASGRTRPPHEKPPGASPHEIVEHGIHVFMGFYEDAFTLMRATYAELDRPEGAPLRTWQDAFKPHDTITLMEHVGGEWLTWPFPIPQMPGEPGLAPRRTDFWEICKESLLHVIEHRLEALVEELAHAGHDVAEPKEESGPHWWNRLKHALHLGGETELPRPPQAPPWWDRLIAEHGAHAPRTHVGGLLQHLLHEIATSLGDDPASHPREKHSWMGWLLDELRKWLHHEAERFLQTHTEIRRIFIMLDYAATHLRGILADGLLLPGGFETINDQDWKAWLASHRGSPWMLESPMVSCFYELTFQYPSGDQSQPGDLEAGSQVHLMLQGMGYRGGALYKMQAGMGDVVMAPLYEVLTKRGVKFEFFHRVTELVAAPAQNGLAPKLTQVKVSQQVTFPPGKEYEPLFDVPYRDPETGVEGTLPCFPQRPFYEQIVEGPTLEKDDIDLESHWTPWQDTGPTKVLEAGKDFDHVVYNIGVAAIPDLCKSLLESQSDAGARWRALQKAVPTVQTQFVSLHLRPTVREMGWTDEDQSPVLGTYSVSPLSNWADETDTRPAEDWPDGEVGNIAYLCGIKKGSEGIVPREFHDYPKTQLAEVDATCDSFLAEHAGVLWPKAMKDGRFDPSLMVSKVITKANIDPSERYAQSPRNSTIHKLPPGDSGFEGLFLAGDWTKNGTNIGNVEGAVSSGLQCAQAIDEASRAGAGLSYVNHGGMVSLPAPVAMPNSTMHGFVLNGDKARIQHFLDRLFLDATGGELRFVPLTHQVLLAFADLPRVSSPALPDWGWGKEHDVGFWVPVAGLRRKAQGGWSLDRVAWFMPYVFVDQGTALVTGREVYGFLKEWGPSQIPEDPLGGGPFTLDASAIEKFSPDSEGTIRRVVTLTQRAGAKTGDAAIQSEYEDFAALHKHLVRTLVPKEGIGLDDGTTLDAKALWAELEAMLFRQEMPMVFFKQFRTIEAGNGACYQAVTQANIKLGRFHGIHLHPSYDFKLEPLANLPITQDLGVADQQVLMQLVVNLDLQMETGEVLWERSGTEGDR